MTKRGSSSPHKVTSRRRSLNRLKTGGSSSKELALTSSHEIAASHDSLGSDALPTTGVRRDPSKSWTFTGTPFQVGMVLCGRYRLERELGRGGMGVVYLALDLDEGEHCAIKALYPMLPKDALEEEFALTKRLDHPYIIRMDRIEEEPTSKICFVVMEYVEGRSLEDYFEEAQAKGTPFFLDDEMLRDFLEHLSDALVFAHERGVIHRDLKPANILLASDGTLRLLDFSIAKRLEAQTIYMTAHRGTPVYMAPEQLTGNARLTPAVDIYAVGAMVYQGLTGILPYGRLRPPSELLRAQHGDLPFDERLDHVLLQALEHDPSERPASMDDFVDALFQALDDAQQKPFRRPRRVAHAKTTSASVEAPLEENEKNQERGKSMKITERTHRAVMRQQTKAARVAQRSQARQKRREDRVAQSQIYQQLQTPKWSFGWSLSFWGVLGALLLSWLFQGGLALGWVHEADLWSWVLLGGLGVGFLAGLGRDDRLGIGAFWMSWVGVLYLGGFVLGSSLGLLFLKSLLGQAHAETMALAFRETSNLAWWAVVSGALGTLFVWWVVVPSARTALKRGWSGLFVGALKGLWRATSFSLVLLGGLEIFARSAWQQSFLARAPEAMASTGIILLILGGVFGLLSAFFTVWTERFGAMGYLFGLFLVIGLLGGQAEGDIPQPPTPYQICLDVFRVSDLLFTKGEEPPKTAPVPASSAVPWLQDRDLLPESGMPPQEPQQVVPRLGSKPSSQPSPAPTSFPTSPQSQPFAPPPPDPAPSRFPSPDTPPQP